MSFFSSGTTARKTDTRWTRWAKMVFKYQETKGTTDFTPSKSDGVRQLKSKLLRLINS